MPIKNANGKNIAFLKTDKNDKLTFLVNFILNHFKSWQIVDNVYKRKRETTYNTLLKYKKCIVNAFWSYNGRTGYILIMITLTCSYMC